VDADVDVSLVSSPPKIRCQLTYFASSVQEVVLPKAGVLTYDTSSVSLDNATSCGVNYYKHCGAVAGQQLMYSLDPCQSS